MTTGTTTDTTTGNSNEGSCDETALKKTTMVVLCDGGIDVAGSRFAGLGSVAFAPAFHPTTDPEPDFAQAGGWSDGGTFNCSAGPGRATHQCAEAASG